MATYSMGGGSGGGQPFFQGRLTTIIDIFTIVPLLSFLEQSLKHTFVTPAI